MLPNEFIQTLSTLPNLDATALCNALEGASPVSIRFNPFKVTEQPQGRQVPWCRYGYYLEERPSFTLDPAFHAGAYYVQEAGSMFIGYLLECALQSTAGEFPSGLRILDLCAAPGGKTTLLATLAGLESLVVANEVVRSRAATLADNVKKWGLGNVAVTNNDPSHFSAMTHYFDVITVDAPCSGEGMFRKDPQARQQWSPAAVELCAARQRRILSDVWNALKPGGILIYSTCTFNRTENEENIEWLCQEFDCEPVAIPILPEWHITYEESCGIQTFRFYPHLTESEGFFAAIVRKGEGKRITRLPKARRSVFVEPTRQETALLQRWFRQPEYMHMARIGDSFYSYYAARWPEIRTLSEQLSVLYSGVQVGQIFSGKLRPEHSLALFHDLERHAVPIAEFDLENALRYLRKQEVDPTLLREGINLVCYKNLPLGWIKRIGMRNNNMYPKELRIINL